MAKQTSGKQKNSVRATPGRCKRHMVRRAVPVCAGEGDRLSDFRQVVDLSEHQAGARAHNSNNNSNLSWRTLFLLKPTWYCSRYLTSLIL
jgi:hypothetical protein